MCELQETVITAESPFRQTVNPRHGPCSCSGAPNVSPDEDDVRMAMTAAFGSSHEEATHEAAAGEEQQYGVKVEASQVS